MESPSKKMKRYSQNFREEWLKDTELQSWLKRDDEDRNCSYCKCCNVSLKNYNKSMLIKHQNSVKHKKNINVAKSSKDITQFMTPIVPKESKQIAKSEALIAGYFAEHDIPFSSIDHLLPLCERVFPDSKIAKKLSMKRTKLSYVIQDGIAFHERNSVANICKEQKFSIIIDESTDISVTQVLAVVVHFFDREKLDVIDRLLDAVTVENGSSLGLYKSVKSLLEKHSIPIHNVIGLGADNCSTMMGVKNGFQKLLKDDVPSVFVMGCVCHSFNLCASHAVGVLPSYLESFLKDLTSYFSRSSKRQSDFMLVQEAISAPAHKIPKLAQTRWLSRENVISAILENYDALLLYFQSESKVDKVDGARKVYEILNNRGTKHMLLFLQYVLQKVNTLNLEYQSEHFRLHSLHLMVTSEYRNLLRCFVNENTIQSVKLSDIDPSDVRNHLNVADIYLGARAMALLISEPLPNDAVVRFKGDCLKFIVELCGQIKKRFQLNDDSIVSKLNILDPKIASNTNLSVSSITSIALKFPSLISDDQLNTLDDQWRCFRLSAKDLPISSKSIPEYWYNLNSIKDGVGNSKYGILSNFMTDLTALPHSSACVERIFSQVNNIKTKKTNSLKVQTLADRIVAKQSISKHNLNCSKWEPSEDLVSDIENKIPSKRYSQRLKILKENNEVITLEGVDGDY